MTDDLQRENDKVLTKQTKNQTYLQLCRSKAYCIVQYTSLLEAAI